MRPLLGSQPQPFFLCRTSRAFQESSPNVCTFTSGCFHSFVFHICQWMEVLSGDWEPPGCATVPHLTIPRLPVRGKVQADRGTSCVPLLRHVFKTTHLRCNDYWFILQLKMYSLKNLGLIISQWQWVHAFSTGMWDYTEKFKDYNSLNEH